MSTLHRKNLLNLFYVNRLYGLIGYPLGHSWSKNYFEKKFEDLGVHDASYELFPIQNIGQVKQLISENPDLVGFNVTIPHKTLIIPFLDSLDTTAAEIQAVNVVRVERKEKRVLLHGYNTDAFGFEQSIIPLLNTYDRQALILGIGGAAKAAARVFRKLNIDYVFVSRNPSGSGQICYNDLNCNLIEQKSIIINATPLGMHPDVLSYPPLPYAYINSRHLLFDMIYNPKLTKFLQLGLEHGARIKNGLDMLHFQAEKAWDIWNS